MCGIAGGVGRIDEHTVRQMCRVMVHRGPDHTGVRAFESAVLGMVRLSIIDLAGGMQPLANEDESVWVVFNGEIYNFEELREDLIARGHVFRTRSDTEVIVHAYETYGDDFLTHLRGMFAIALWDRPRQRLVLARDRLGEKPLYYTHRDGTLRFGSEIKCLLETDLPRAANHGAVASFLSLGYVPGDETAYADIRKLNPGEYLVFEGGQVSKQLYWQLTPAPQLELSFDQAVDQLDALLIEAVRYCMKSDVEVAAFLSGGVDSSLIVALMKKLGAHVRTYSVGFGEEAAGFNELSYARQVAEHLGTTHQELILDAASNLELLPKIAAHYDEPNGEPTSMLVYLLCQFVARDVKVAMGGTGGDELFQGYPRHSAISKLKLTQHVPELVAAPVRWLVEQGKDSTDGNRMMKRLKRFAATLGHSPEDSYVSWLQLIRPDVRESLFEYPESPGTALIRRRMQAAADLMSGVMAVDVCGYLPEYQLTYMDRMSMATSLEVRSPLCDYRVAEMAAALPHSYRLKGMRTKHILKEVALRYLPAEIVDRKKVGFDSPIGQWFKGELRPFVEQFLSERAVAESGLLEPAGVSRMVAAHLNGHQDYSMQLWSLISLEFWHRLFIQGRPVDSVSRAA